MTTLTPEFIYEALGFNASAQKGLQAGTPPFKSVVTDSRKIEADCLFVAIQGEKHDGHEFIQAAVEKGARGIICRRGTAVTPKRDLHIFPVENTLLAYRKLGAAWRREFSIPVIAVAGSVGKTTTKEILSAILRGKWPHVLRTQGSQNGYVGIPMTLLEIRPEHGAAVVEVGIDEIGAMEKHMPLVAANAALLTAIAPEHLEKLLDIPTVAREEGIALTTVATAGGLVAINLDDPWIRPHFSTIRTGKKIAYTLNPENTPASSLEDALIGKLSPDGKRLHVSGLASAPLSFAMPLPGRHNAGNLLAAIAVAHGIGLTPKQIEAGLKTFAGAEGRSELQKLPNGTPVVCDYYNASPASMEAGLQLLTDVAAPNKARRWACLGDMLELGTNEEGYHRQLAGSLMRLGIENVLLYGPRMQSLHSELQQRSYKGGLSHHLSHEEIATILTEKCAPTDAILIKGSRGMKMEEVWKALNKH